MFQDEYFDEVGVNGTRCESCQKYDGRECNWTPDGLELICDECADKPRHDALQNSRREMRGYGQFTWYKACDCNGR